MLTPVASTKKGIALFIAVIAVSALLLISFSIADISYKQQLISASGRDSKGAFYAADTGLECALYHDLKVEAFFPTDSPAGGATGNISCDGRTFQGVVLPTSVPVSNISTTTSTFEYDISSAYCVKVDVQKVSNSLTGDVATSIISRGYNATCASIANPLNNTLRNVERALEVKY